MADTAKEDAAVERCTKLFDVATNGIRSGDDDAAIMALEEILKTLNTLPKKG